MFNNKSFLGKEGDKSPLDSTVTSDRYRNEIPFIWLGLISRLFLTLTDCVQVDRRLSTDVN